MTGDKQIFKLVILLTLQSSKMIVIFLTLGKLKLALLVYFYRLWAGHSYFAVFGQDVMARNTIQNLTVRQ